MAREINLLPKLDTFSPEQIRLKKFVSWGLPLILVIYVLTLSVILVFVYSVNQQLADADKAILEEKSKIGNLSRNESVYLLLKQKASALNKILTSHYPYRQQLEYFKSLAINGNEIKNIEISESGQVILTVKTADTGKLDELISQILKSAEKRFRKVELQGIQYIPGGNITLTLNLDMTNVKI